MVLYRCKESYTITVKDEDGSFLWNFMLGSTQENADTDTIWLHTMNVYQD